MGVGVGLSWGLNVMPLERDERCPAPDLVRGGCKAVHEAKAEERQLISQNEAGNMKASWLQAATLSLSHIVSEQM